MNKNQRAFFQKVKLSIVTISVLMIIFGIGTMVNLFAESAGGAETAVQSAGAAWGLIAAAIAFGFGAVGAGIAVGNVGAAAMGAISEKPEIAGQALLFVAMGEGIVVFGFITALMILGKV